MYTSYTVYFRVRGPAPFCAYYSLVIFFSRSLSNECILDLGILVATGRTLTMGFTWLSTDPPGPDWALKGP